MYGALEFELPILAGADRHHLNGGGDLMGGRAAGRLSAPGAIALAQYAAVLVGIQVFAEAELPLIKVFLLVPGHCLSFPARSGKSADGPELPWENSRSGDRSMPKPMAAAGWEAEGRL